MLKIQQKKKYFPHMSKREPRLKLGKDSTVLIVIKKLKPGQYNNNHYEFQSHSVKKSGFPPVLNIFLFLLKAATPVSSFFSQLCIACGDIKGHLKSLKIYLYVLFLVITLTLSTVGIPDSCLFTLGSALTGPFVTGELYSLVGKK